MANKKDLTLDVGATFRLPIQWQQSDGTPYDLTGWTAKMQIRASYADDTVLVEASSANGRIDLTDAATGWLVVTIAADITTTLSGSGVYDIELTNPADGFVKRLLQGRMQFSPEVTR